MPESVEKSTISSIPKLSFKQIESRLIRSPAMCRALATEHDETLGGIPVIAGKPQTLYALERLGMVEYVQRPQWSGSIASANLTPLGRGWRQEIREHPGYFGSFT